MYLQRFKVRKANGVKGTIFLPHVFHIVHYALMPVICRVAEIISTQAHKLWRKLFYIHLNKIIRMNNLMLIILRKIQKKSKIPRYRFH